MRPPEVTGIRKITACRSQRQGANGDRRVELRSCAYHLEERQVALDDVVEVDLRVDPRVAAVAEPQAIGAVDHDGRTELLAAGVDALVELAAKQLDAGDTEDQPEDEADEQDVDDRRDGVHQRVDDDLRARRRRE